MALFVPPSREKAWKEIQVTEGMSFKAIAGKLQQEGIIRYRGYFEIFGRLQGISRKVRATSPLRSRIAWNILRLVLE